jgi:F-type H+-transporting ATPase subunit alpha
MRRVAGRLRLDLAQFRELEAFASFGSELDTATQRQLARGERTVEVLKQPQYAPMPFEKQVMILYAVTNGHLDDLPLDSIRAFEAGFHEFMETSRPDVGEAIRETRDITKEIEEKLVAAIAEFKEIFTAQAAGV